MSRTCRVLILLTLCAWCSCEQNASVAASSRAGRQLDLPRDVRVVRIFVDQHKHLRRPPQIQARSDHFPQRIGPGPGPGPYGRPQFGRPPPPQSHLRRRVHTGPPGPPPPGAFLRPNGPPPPPPFNNFQAFKNGRYPVAKGPYPQKGGPNNFYRPGQPQHAPNSIVQGPNFKPSPIYNGEVIVRRPSSGPLVAGPPSVPPTQKPHQQAPPPPPPAEKHEALRHYKSNQVAIDTNHMYSVYEDTDSEPESFPPHSNIGENAMQEAKHYLNFMSSSDYFLPKVQPDYRQLDQQQQQQQHSDSAALSAFQEQQRNAAESAAFTVNAPLRVSASQSQPARSPAQASLGSYQPENNVFVVSSDGMKNMHHVVPAPSATYGEPSQQQLSMPTFSSGLRPMLKERVPDPERVEFTERDAIHVSYTSNPMDSMTRYGEQQQQQPQQPLQPTEHLYGGGSSEDEMMQSASDVYGRVKVTAGESPSHATTAEQKDTEEYCERICSNVQDEDEEVVCGSDGYMYTSEAQMECYASCLHIDVTIQSKGTCNQSL